MVIKTPYMVIVIIDRAVWSINNYFALCCLMCAVNSIKRVRTTHFMNKFKTTWNLFLPLIFLEVRVCSAPVLGFFVWNSDFGTLFVSPQFIVKENCCHTSSLCCFFWSSANPQTYTFMKYNFLNESRLLEQKYQEHWIKSSLRKCYGRYNSLVSKINVH